MRNRHEARSTDQFLSNCAGNSGRKIRDTLLDNVDPSSASSDDREAREPERGAADRQNGARFGQDGPNVPEQPRSSSEDDQPPGNSSAVQTGAAWDKARLNGQGVSPL